jgi:imidazolonepropionase-like amidohydrolase
VLTGGTVFTSPTQAPLTNAVVVVTDGRISAVGKSGQVAIPAGARVIDCNGQFITAGFQNSHVHFTAPQWWNAAQTPADSLSHMLEQMLTRYGVTTAFETASSFVDNSVALRHRVETGEVRGPRILTVGNALYPADGIPYYLRDSMGPDELSHLLTPASPSDATRDVERNLDAGADGLKLFVVSWMGRGATKPMDVAVATAAAAAAHARHKPVFAHPSNTRGVEIALAAHVDILAHAIEDRRGWNPSYTGQMVAAHMAMIPTLKLFEKDAFLWDILEEVGEFSRAGGQILFGTDVGFLPDFDPATEYILMAAAGLTPMQILASLTTAPAQRFGEGDRRGRVAVGQQGDLVLLRIDPRNTVLAFTRVSKTIRAGRVVYEAQP